MPKPVVMERQEDCEPHRHNTPIFARMSQVFVYQAELHGSRACNGHRASMCDGNHVPRIFRGRRPSTEHSTRRASLHNMSHRQIGV